MNTENWLTPATWNTFHTPRRHRWVHPFKQPDGGLWPARQLVTWEGRRKFGIPLPAVWRHTTHRRTRIWPHGIVIYRGHGYDEYSMFEFRRMGTLEWIYPRGNEDFDSDLILAQLEYNAAVADPTRDLAHP